MESNLEAKALIRVIGVNSSISNTGPSRNSFAEFLFERKLLAFGAEWGVSKLVCIDYSLNYRAVIVNSGLEPKSCTLVRMEPSVVLPANFSRLRRKQFGREITVGGRPTGKSDAVHWPLVFPSETEWTIFRKAERSERIVLINGNKMSFVKGELYSLRRKSINTLENLDLYGTEWDSRFSQRLFIAVRSLLHAALSLRLPIVSGISLWFQRYPKSKGPVEDKLATMSRYKYALVIENSAEYMSEKLMEALFAGCIPVYVGPNPEEFGVPKDLVIWTKPNTLAIKNSFAEAAGWNLEEFHARLAVFLSDRSTRELWDHDRVYQKMLDVIQANSS
jgi:hypothetical protein